MPNMLVLFLPPLQKSSVGNWQNKDHGLDGPLVRIHTAVLIFSSSTEHLSAARPTTFSTSASSPLLLCLGKSLWKNCNKYVLHHLLLTWSSAIHSLRRHHIVPWDPLLQMSSTHSPQLMLLSCIWCPWRFGLHIFLSVPLLSLPTFSPHDLVNCALLMG